VTYNHATVMTHLYDFKKEKEKGHHTPGMRDADEREREREDEDERNTDKREIEREKKMFME
jgi:hypothetical protein